MGCRDSSVVFEVEVPLDARVPFALSVLSVLLRHLSQLYEAGLPPMVRFDSQREQRRRRHPGDCASFGSLDITITGAADRVSWTPMA